MRVKIDIELGNDAMKSLHDALDAIERALASHPAFLEDMTTGAGIVKDRNGNSVGTFEVM